MPDIRVGCAGWTLPRTQAGRFPAQGGHLARYAGRFAAVEINTSFYRPHRRATYARWAATVPERFRFAVKLPREITHRRRLRDAAEPLDGFLAAAGGLGDKLGVLLVQLPPSLRFEAALAEAFLSTLRRRFDGAVAVEPRHPSWFVAEPERLLAAFRAARVAADPAPVPGASAPGGAPHLAYYRLHGSPRMYYSDYADEALEALADRLIAARARGAVVWCIFDNTALGAATANALELLERLRRMCGEA